ncbi:MAG TPA: hypothetical protein PLF76_03340, partial [Methanomassiliicoccaceae archaeon]|nr:hypothetical protein [Methanomassiliicoccaceae archaeon]
AIVLVPSAVAEGPVQSDGPNEDAGATLDTTEKVTTVHRFVRNETGPVNGTLILLSLSSGLPLYNASTDVSRGGEYHLKNVQPGSYRVMIVVSTGFLFLEENKEVHEGGTYGTGP